MDTRNFKLACEAIILSLGARAHAETVVPMQGQTPQQIQADTAACQAQAKTAYEEAVTAKCAS